MRGKEGVSNTILSARERERKGGRKRKEGRKRKIESMSEGYKGNLDFVTCAVCLEIKIILQEIRGSGERE